MCLQWLTNFDAKGAKRSLKMWTKNFYESFFKNILLYMNGRLSKIRSVHRYAIPPGRFILIESVVQYHWYSKPRLFRPFRSRMVWPLFTLPPHKMQQPFSPWPAVSLYETSELPEIVDQKDQIFKKWVRLSHWLPKRKPLVTLKVRIWLGVRSLYFFLRSDKGYETKILFLKPIKT